MDYRITDQCVVCWRCMDSCPNGAIIDCEIHVTDKYSMPGVTINDLECSKCGLCKEVCPVDAIVVNE
ncbi:MAG: 4Fe-4S dicluster domain-containing protein [Desulfobacteraceae bacterium]|nr:MAG: 4Fe-4S dicluster domain-containing protein [Desulfobacteraceae bacterium]